MEQPEPPHWPHSNTQQAPLLDSMPLTPLLQVPAIDGVIERGGRVQMVLEALASTRVALIFNDIICKKENVCLSRWRKCPQAHRRQSGAFRVCPWPGRMSVPLGKSLGRKNKYRCV